VFGNTAEKVGQVFSLPFRCLNTQEDCRISIQKMLIYSLLGVCGDPCLQKWKLIITPLPDTHSQPPTVNSTGIIQDLFG
jgi:hypothetical protein